MSAPLLPRRLEKAPKAFARWAEDHNQMLAALEILCRLKGGTGIRVDFSERDVSVTNTRPDLPIYAGTGISITTTTNSVTVTNLNPPP